MMVNKTVAERIAEARRKPSLTRDMAKLNTQVLDKVLHQIKVITASCTVHHLQPDEGTCLQRGDVQMENQLAVLDQRLGVYFELCRQVQPEGLIDGFPSLSSAGESAAKDVGVKGKGM